MKWCQCHWRNTFLKALQSGNYITYHDCCTCFSRRCYSKNAGHPSLQSCIITRMPSFKEVSNETDFFKWLFKLLETNTKKGQRCFFPAINRPHIVAQEVDNERLEDEVQMLRKRVEFLEKSEEELVKNMSALKEENQRLIKSTKNWYLKYQELIEPQDKAISSTFNTPMKKTSNLNFYFLEELL